MPITLYEARRLPSKCLTLSATSSALESISFCPDIVTSYEESDIQMFSDEVSTTLTVTGSRAPVLMCWKLLQPSVQLYSLSCTTVPQVSTWLGLGQVVER